MDEMDMMLRSMSASGGESSGNCNPPLTPNFDNVNKRNELTELNSKLSRKNSGNNNGGGMTASKNFNFII